ncbi:MAG: hypothetical protein QXO15_03275 [Nitrososphaerota archaeon]
MKWCEKCGNPFIPGIFYVCPVSGRLMNAGDICVFERHRIHKSQKGEEGE